LKSDIERKIDARVATAFEDMVLGMQQSQEGNLKSRTRVSESVWFGKIYAAMPADQTTLAEYFLDQELEQFLNEAVEECHKKIESIAYNVKTEFNQ
jgi:hypothetical protein